jgi:hypothetical protein
MLHRIFSGTSKFRLGVCRTVSEPRSELGSGRLRVSHWHGGRPGAGAALAARQRRIARPHHHDDNDHGGPLPPRPGRTPSRIAGDAAAVTVTMTVTVTVTV